jgi:hypothetical protein
MVTKEQFLAYLAVRDSGATNMFDIKAVAKYAKKLAGISLSREICLEIMRDFMKLKYEYVQSKKES